MREKENRLTANIARDLLAYEPDTGVLTWLPRPHNPSFKNAGLRAGNQRHNGRWYTGVTVNGRINLYGNHRLAWLIHYGEWPCMAIDHINGDPSDNRINNLRLATNAQNMANQRMRRDNTSGCRGVYWIEHRKKWVALIHEYGGGTKQRNIYLGAFDDFTEAVRVRQEAARKHFGEFANETPIDQTKAG